MRFFARILLAAIAAPVDPITAFSVMHLFPNHHHHPLVAITTTCQVSMDEIADTTSSQSLVKDVINNSSQVHSQKEEATSRLENGVNGTLNVMNLEQPQQIVDKEAFVDEKEDEEVAFDIQQMRHAIRLAQFLGDDETTTTTTTTHGTTTAGAASPYPKPIAGAVIVDRSSGKILGQGRSDYHQDCIRAAFENAGLVATPLREWCVSWPVNRALRESLARSTLYTTLEPSDRAKGEALPPITQLIEQSGIPRVVIGCADPIPERAMEGAARLHSAGISVSLGVEQEECERLIEDYAELANSKLQVMSRKFAERFGRVRHKLYIGPTMHMGVACVILENRKMKLIVLFVSISIASWIPSLQCRGQ